MEEELQCWSSDWLDHWNCSLLSFSVGSGGNRGLSWHDSRRCLHGNGAHTSEVCPASLLAPRMTAHDQRVQARGMGTQSGGRMQRLMRLNGNWSLGAAGVALQRTKPPPPWPSELKTFVMVNDVMSFVRGLCMLICVCERERRWPKQISSLCVLWLNSIPFQHFYLSLLFILLIASTSNQVSIVTSALKRLHEEETCSERQWIFHHCDCLGCVWRWNMSVWRCSCSCSSPCLIGGLRLKQADVHAE